MPKVLTSEKCHCGYTLEIEVSRSESQGGVGWGRFSRDSGRDKFALRCICRECGTVFDPDRPRFASYYNMAADGAYSTARAQPSTTVS